MAAADPKGEGPITGQELKDLFSTGYYASCTYFNDLPPYWQVDIVQIGCKFVDDDGNNDNKGANVRIQSGQNQTLTSTCQGCCRMYFVVMKARAADGNEWNLANSATVESGYCGGNLKWHLVQKTKFMKGDVTNAAPFELVVEQS
jgi:hypothetical protein